MSVRASELREHLSKIWHSGVEAVSPERLLHSFVLCNDEKLKLGKYSYDLALIPRIWVLSVGKGSVPMAKSLLELLESQSSKIRGWAIGPGEHNEKLGPLLNWGVRPIGINEPTSAAVEATKSVVETLGRETQPNALLIFMLSGGASATLCLPKPPITLQEKLAVTRMLANAGASIAELNAVRRRMSLVKGGQLAALFPGAFCHTLAISDVCGDDPHVIGSGPTAIGQPKNLPDAYSVLEKFQLDQHATIQKLKNVFEATESPKPSTQCDYTIVGSNDLAKKAAANRAKELGYRVIINNEPLTGHTDEAGKELSRLINEAADAGPTCIISGGETTVPLTENPGKGGRNMDLAARLLQNINPWPENLYVLSAGTDGEDGPTDAAGAFADFSVVDNTRKFYQELDDAVLENDTYPFFEKNQALFKSGLTGTNVMDLQVVVFATT